MNFFTEADLIHTIKGIVAVKHHIVLLQQRRIVDGVELPVALILVLMARPSGRTVEAHGVGEAALEQVVILGGQLLHDVLLHAVDLVLDSVSQVFSMTDPGERISTKVTLLNWPFTFHER